METLSDLMGWTSPEGKPHIKHYWNLVQHTDEWLEAKCGILSASAKKGIITATGKIADNEKTRAILYEIVAQRVTQDVGENFQSWDMLRGIEDEVIAGQLYNQHHAPLVSCGFIVNDKHGFKMGYSPDGLTEDGLGQIETKSRAPKFQIETILSDDMPAEFSIQVQDGLIVSEREFCDFNSFCGGMPMFTKRIYPDEKMQKLILEATEQAEEKMDRMERDYRDRILNDPRLIPTKKRPRDISA